MCDLLRVWRRVEALPVPAGIQIQWKEWLGGDYAVVTPFLKPEQALARGYPCPNPVHEGCPRRVVHHGKDDIVAVCGSASAQCDPISLSRKDVVIWSLDREEWVAAVARSLRDRNLLDALDLDTPDGIVVLGTLRRRGKRLAVVWVRNPEGDLGTLLDGILARVQGDGLIAVLPSGSRNQADQMAGGVIRLTPPAANDGDLALWRALDLLDGTYKERRATDPSALFDDVRFEFAEEPGVRHIVKINGRVFDGFQKSDIKFLRLVLMAATRRAAADIEEGGWFDKADLLGGEDRDRDLEDVRAELAGHDHPGLSREELKAVIKSKRGTGTIRLAVPPNNIAFDDSLMGFTFIGGAQTASKSGTKRPTPGMAQLAKNLADAEKNGRLLIKAARELGVPFP